MRTTALLLVCFFTACGDDGPAVDAGPATDGAAAGDAGATDAGPAPDAGPACTTDDLGRCHLVEWEDSATFPVAIDHHATFVHSNGSTVRLFVAGGQTNDPADPQTSTVYDTVLSAVIGEDGTLGAWEAEPALPFVLAFHTVVQTEERVYLAGGLSTDADGAFAVGTVQIGTYGADGRIASWEQSGRASSISEPRLHTTASIVRDRLYLVGGSSGRNLTETVESAPLMPDGSVGAFRLETSLPDARSHFASVVVNDAIYLAGGLGGTTLSPRDAPDVLRGTIADDGTVTWDVVGTMPEPPWTHGGFVRDGAFWVVGGGDNVDGGRYVARVRRAFFAPDGTLGAFEDIANDLPFARSHVHQTPVFADVVYSVGGRNFDSQESIDTVVLGRLLPEEHMHTM